MAFGANEQIISPTKNVKNAQINFMEMEKQTTLLLSHFLSILYGYITMMNLYVRCIDMGIAFHKDIVRQQEFSMLLCITINITHISD